MLVLFILLLVLFVLAGVVLAVLRDDEPVLEDVERDGVALSLPAGRAMHGEDVNRLRFSLALRGYRMAEVDQALDRLAAELDDRDATIAELRGHRAEPLDDRADFYAPAETGTHPVMSHHDATLSSELPTPTGRDGDTGAGGG